MALLILDSAVQRLLLLIRVSPPQFLCGKAISLFKTWEYQSTSVSFLEKIGLKGFVGKDNREKNWSRSDLFIYPNTRCHPDKSNLDCVYRT